MKESLITLERLIDTLNLNPDFCTLMTTQPDSPIGIASRKLLRQLLMCETFEELAAVAETWKVQIQAGTETLGFSEQDRELLDSVFGGK